MTFDNNGNLFPYEIIETDLNTFESWFINGFEDSRTRKNIFENYIRYTDAIRELIKEPFFQWIDGSFVTQKINPNDIDVVSFVNYQIYDINEKEIDRLRRLRFEKGQSVDGYFVKIYPPNHKNTALFETDKIQWLYQFSRSKAKESKGIIQINF